MLALASHVPLLADLGLVDRLIPYQGGYRRFFPIARQMRAERPDLALVLHGNEPQATPLAYLSGARFIFKLPNRNRFRFLLSNSDPVIGWESLGHGLDQRLQLARMAGADTTGARMTLSVSTEAVAKVEAWFESAGIAASVDVIGFQPCASSRSRMWPAEYFVSLASRLLQQNPALRFVITGSPGEAAYCQQIAAAIGPSAFVTAGEFSVAELPALVARMRLLVSGDTGTMHVSVAVGTPVVALFAVSDPMRSGPAQDQERHVVIYKPCQETGITSKSDDQRCISRISVEEVETGVLSILQRRIAP